MPLSTVARELDCEWVVGRCKSYLERGDKHGAKAWILTARSLFPDDFTVQYEAFSLHMSCEELKEAAMALTDLFSVFPREPQLQSCLTSLVEALLILPAVNSTPNAQEKTVTQKKLLFSQLPPHIQKSVLLHAAEESSSVLRQCKVWMVIIKLFPEFVKTLGLDAYDLLSKEPSTTMMADNEARELLVCEVIPLLLSSPEIRLELPVGRSSGQSTALKTSHLCQWLESVASFYTTITSQALLCGKGHRCAGKVGWDQLHQLLMRTAEKCGWREVILSNQIGPHLPSRVRWMGLEKLSGYNPHVKPFEAPRPVAIACFYIAVFLFFETAWEYCHEMLAPAFGGSSVPVGSRAPWLVVADYQHHPSPQEDKSSKRRKTDDSRATLNFNTGSRSVDQKMVERFMVATECWDFLQSNVTYQQEFMRLSQQWGALEWSWLGMFRADMAMFKCDHTPAMQILTHEWHKVTEEEKTSPMATRTIMQMVNCSMVLGDSKGACGSASEVISLLPSSQSLSVGASSTFDLASGHSSGRQLRLLCCSPNDILPFCMEVITRTLKDVAFSDAKNEHALGQLLVLLQYQWPKEEEIFASLITTIQKRRRFHFPEFFDYVILIDFLEEMLHLANSESLQIIILPQADANKGRTVTRGVNRGAREELMIAMEQQIRRCDEPIEPLLRQFFKQEKLSFGGKYAVA